jgi:small subunit ribosomal protein S13
MRILGITIPEEKRIEIGLTVLYGVGRSLSHTILDKAKVDYGTKPKDITIDQENAIRKVIETLKIEGDRGGDYNFRHGPYVNAFVVELYAQDK